MVYRTIQTQYILNSVNFDGYPIWIIYLKPKVTLQLHLYEEIFSHFSFDSMGIFIRLSCHALSEEVQTNHR